MSSPQELEQHITIALQKNWNRSSPDIWNSATKYSIFGDSNPHSLRSSHQLKPWRHAHIWLAIGRQRALFCDVTPPVIDCSSGGADGAGVGAIIRSQSAAFLLENSILTWERKNVNSRKSQSDLRGSAALFFTQSPLARRKEAEEEAERGEGQGGRSGKLKSGLGGTRYCLRQPEATLHNVRNWAGASHKFINFNFGVQFFS